MNITNRRQKIVSTFLLMLVIGATGFISVGTPFFLLRHPKIFAVKTKDEQVHFLKIKTKG